MPVEHESTERQSFVLVTPAYNEAALIEKVIESVIAQTLRPKKWIIVSDGSTDGTDEIVLKHAASHEFIELFRITEEHPRNWAAQVNAIKTGYSALQHLDFDFFGNLDADITFEPGYFENLISKFKADPQLGLAGGYIHEPAHGSFQVRSTNNQRSVPHAIQFFRRECYEAIGGYVPLQYGGPDWHAELCVRMKGWNVSSFTDLKVFHHRPTGGAESFVKHRFRQGLMDFSLGSDPTFEFIKCAKRIPHKPIVLGAVARFSGFVWAYISGKKVLVSGEFVDFIRRDQRQRLRLHS